VGKDDPMYKRDVGLSVYGRYDDATNFNVSNEQDRLIRDLLSKSSDRVSFRSALLPNKKVDVGQSRQIVNRMLSKVRFRADSID